jgi:energy-coupling factor transporter ATP-binding protein EcfA2
LHPGGDYCGRRTGDDGYVSRCHHPVVILFDSGASHTFMSNTFVEKHCIHSTKSREGFVFQSPGGQIFTKEVVFHVPVTLAGHEFPTNMIVIKGPDIDVILGMNWLAQNKAIIHADQRTIQLSRGQEVQLSIPVSIDPRTSPDPSSDLSHRL